MDLNDHAAFWLELHPDLVPLVLDRHPELLEWRSFSGQNLPEHLLSWPGPFPGKYAVVSRLLQVNPQWGLSSSTMDEAVRKLALAQAEAQIDPFTGRPVYEPGEDYPLEPGQTGDLAYRFAASLKETPPDLRSRRLQRMGRVFQLDQKSGGPFHNQIRQAFEKEGVLTSVKAYARDARPVFNIPQRPSVTVRPAPRAKYENEMVRGRPLEAARRVWELGMTPEAKGKMLAKLLSRRLGVARRARRTGGLKTRWQSRSSRKFEYVDFRRFLQALAITAPSESMGQAVILPSLQGMMEEAMLEDDQDLFRALHPGQTPADVSRRLTKRALKIARQFAPINARLVARLAHRPLPYTSRHASVARHALRAHFEWEDPGLAMSFVHPDPVVGFHVDQEERLTEERRLDAERLKEERRLEDRLAARRQQEALRLKQEKKEEKRRQNLIKKQQNRRLGIISAR